MLQWKRNESAFTLIELLVVVIIVAVLAGVGVPLLSANVQRARASEADAGLGTIRTGLRAYFAENTTYVGATLTNIGLRSVVADNNDDLGGRYFDDNDFTLPTLTAVAYCIQATGGTDPDEAPQAAQVTAPNQVTHSMNQNGTICNTACPCAG